MTKCSASSLVSFNSDHFVVRIETYLVWQVGHDFPDGSLDVHFSVISTDAPAAWTSGSASVDRLHMTPHPALIAQMILR